jgi:hypothetical protein
LDKIKILLAVAGCKWLMPVILATWEVEIWRIVVPSQSWEIVPETPIFKITRGKWTGRVTQVVKCLICEHEALSSKPQSNWKKEKKIFLIKVSQLIEIILKYIAPKLSKVDVGIKVVQNEGDFLLMQDSME